MKIANTTVLVIAKERSDIDSAISSLARSGCQVADLNHPDPFF
jgi:hypothetical protein